MKTYTTKITDYGYKERVTIYEKEIVYDEPKETSTFRQRYEEMTEDKKVASDRRRIRYYKNAIAELIEIALMNRDLNVAITLTFKKTVTSYDLALAEWQLFLKRLRHIVKEPLKYICVWEYQQQRSKNLGLDKGGVFHFHCLMNIGFIEHSILEKTWGKGYVWIDKLSSDDKLEHAIRYTTKYCVKEIISRIENNEDVRGQRFYFTSNNLLKPTTTILESKLYIEDIIFEHMEDIIKDVSYDVKNELGMIVNHIEYVEYKKKGK